MISVCIICEAPSILFTKIMHADTTSSPIIRNIVLCILFSTRVSARTLQGDRGIVDIFQYTHCHELEIQETSLSHRSALLNAFRTYPKFPKTIFSYFGSAADKIFTYTQ